ncbi:tetratricopeptide repeat protein [Candidatus Poribacteria bacterium]|nr:tetratricopeptide repeat protein [Candidatus Poribacteria bacterium]
MKKLYLSILIVILFIVYVIPVWGKSGVPERDYRIAVILFNESEFENAEMKFTTVINDGDLSIPDGAAYVINSYYGRASCRIEQGRKFKEERKFADAIKKYEEAYEDLSKFKDKFEELQDTLKSHSLYDEIEKHFITISDQIVQLAGEAGDIGAKQGNYNKAIDWYDKGLMYINPQSDTYGDILYAKADALFQLDEYEDTLDILYKFEDELAEHEKSSDAMLFVGDIHRMLAETTEDESDTRRHLQNAVDAYTQVIESYPVELEVDLVKDARLERARSEKELGLNEQALADFQNIQTLYPGTRYEIDAALEIGDYAFLSKDYSKAIEDFTKAAQVAKSMDLQDRMAVAYYWIGWSYFSEANRIDTEASPEMRRRSRNLYEQSIEAFEDSIKSSEKFWNKEGMDSQMARELEEYYGESLFMMGRGYQGLEKWDDAIETFEKVPQKYRKWWLESLAEIALSTERQGDIQGSLDKWDELKKQIALARIPNIEQNLLMRRAESIFDLQRYEQAEEAYREIINRFPNSSDEPRARINLGLSLFKQNRSREAIQEFTYMLDKYSSNESVGTAIGEALFWKGYLSARLDDIEGYSMNLKQAIRDYRELIRRFPQHIRADDAQFEIGFCTYSLGSLDESKYTEAITEYSKLLENYPISEYSDDALFEIARCYRLMENQSKEEESLQKLVADYPESDLADDALLRVAEIHFEKAQTTDNEQERQLAENTYTEIVTKYPDTESEAIAHFQMAAMFYKFDGDFRTAASEFAKSAGIIERILERVLAGESVSAELDIATVANLLLRATFWQAESMFRHANYLEYQAQPAEVVKQVYRQAREIFNELLARGTRLRNDFPQRTQNLYNIMGGEKLDIPLVSEAQLMISRCLYKEGDYQAALEKLQTIGENKKLKLKADYLKAYIAYKQGNLTQAKSLAENWLDTEITEELADEYNVGMQVLLSKIELDSGSSGVAKALALDTWALFQSIDGLWEESAYIVAKSYQKENDIEKAKSWFERLQSSSLEMWRVAARDALTKITGQ